MTNLEETHVKVMFKFHSSVLDEDISETMLSEKIDVENGIYRLDNIPFYGAPIATGDEFFAELDAEEQMLVYRKTTKYSGNSIILVLIARKGYDKEIIRDEFNALNCTSEGVTDSYFAMEILAETNYSVIKQKLQEFEKARLIDYAEPYLSEKHMQDIEEEK